MGLLNPNRDMPLPPAPPEDFGLFHDYDYLEFRFSVWVRSGYTVYPKAGAMDDQEASLIADFTTLLARLDYHVSVLKPISGGT